MSRSKVDIFNFALGFLGFSDITDEDEKSQEARACLKYWDLARRTVLRDFPYSFAQRRSLLASLQMPLEYPEYEYAYAMPTDMIKANFIISGSTTYKIDEVEKDFFRIVQNSNTMPILLCNLETCILDYTSDVGDMTKFNDDSFVEMVSYKLASLICTPLLRNNSSKLQELTQLYQISLGKATQNDANSRKTKKAVDSWVAISRNN